MTSESLSGRTAVVTGGAKGIGRACAEALAALGASVVVVDIDATGASVAESLGGLFVAADVSVATDAERVAHEAAGAFGTIDVLVNNAGIQRYGTVADTPESTWDEVIAVNLKSVYLMSRACIPHMNTGSIVNVASVQAIQSQRKVAAYAASKGGVVALTRSMAVDLAPAIRVNAVCPGGVDTPMAAWAAEQTQGENLSARGGGLPFDRPATPDEIAAAVVFLAGPQSSYVTGACLVADGGLLAAL